ncbi:MAG: GNAT family N-acetyltransferase [Chloroflexi bacterium]|nr:GNAT family N-acetyltransferase [Chloroflexota bacterium]
MKIPAGRYLIRSFEDQDAAAMAEHVSNPNVTRTLAARFPSPYTEEHAKAWISLCHLEAEPVNFAITENGDLVGGIGLTVQRGARRRAAEVGFWVAEAHWGKGIATEALQAFTDYAFSRFDLIRLFAYVFEGNTRSTRVLEKVGFTYEGTLESSIVKNDEVYGELVFALVRPQIVP